MVRIGGQGTPAKSGGRRSVEVGLLGACRGEGVQHRRLPFGVGVNGIGIAGDGADVCRLVWAILWSVPG